MRPCDAPPRHTQAKLLNSPVACPTSGCDSVLSSPYAYLYGVPLSLLGMLAYGGVAALAGMEG